MEWKERYNGNLCQHQTEIIHFVFLSLMRARFASSRCFSSNRNRICLYLRAANGVFSFILQIFYYARKLIHRCRMHFVHNSVLNLSDIHQQPPRQSSKNHLHRGKFTITQSIRFKEYEQYAFVRLGTGHLKTFSILLFVLFMN